VETEVHFHIRRIGITCEFVDGIIWLPQHVPGDVTSAEVSIFVSGLTSNANYHFYSGARNITSQDYVHGDELSFTTLVDSGAKGFAIPLFFKDQSTIIPLPRKFGVHTRATYCVDLQLGECALPPMPPSGLEYRFIDPRSDLNSCFDLGIYQDLRHYNDSTQIDTFKVKFQSSAYPVIFSWPDLHNYYTGSVRLIDLFGGIIVNTDMKAQNSDTIMVSLNELLIIAEGPINLINANFDYWTNNSVIISSSFNPAGLSTHGWFEWGFTSNYDNSTSKKYIGNGTSVTEFRDSLINLQPDTVYHYRAVAENANGIVYGIDQAFETPKSATDATDLPTLPTTYRLYQNYPNPFNPSTIIEFDLPVASHVVLKIYNIFGQEVKTLLNETRQAGINSVTFEMSGLASGIYFYRMSTGLFSDIKKMILIK
jgi:hypothetical protein